MVKIKYEVKVWSIYFLTILLFNYIHELGHCVPAWMNGFRAVPTPAKEYTLDAVPVYLQQYISFGGVICTILISLIVMFLYLNKTYLFNSAILAGAIANPGLYTLMFILRGRGHDSTEFQEAQSVMGLSYSGHSLDYIFLILLMAGIVIWIIRSKPRFKITGRLLIGFIVTFIFLIGLQKINNLIFDPIFLSK